MTGITAARALRHVGVEVMLVDKGRAVGGRMATRRIGEATFDHGAQHISVSTEAFEREIEALVQEGTADVWFRSESVSHPERGIVNRYAGVGGMRRIPEALAEGLVVSTGVAVDRLRIDADRVAAFAEGTPVATADAAILTPPLPQTRQLLAASNVDRGDSVAALAGVEYDATLAVMVVLALAAGVRYPQTLMRGEGDHVVAAPVRHRRPDGPQSQQGTPGEALELSGVEGGVGRHHDHARAALRPLGLD